MRTAPPPPPPPPPPLPVRPQRDRAEWATTSAKIPPAKQWRSFRSRLAWLARLALVGAGIAVSFALDGGIFGVLVALFVLVVPFEKLYPRKKGQKLRRPMLGTDIGFALLGPMLSGIGAIAAAVIAGVSLFWVPGLLLRPLVAALPTWLMPIVAFVLFDMLVYWTHRWAHEVPFLWRFHAVHHSPEHMDWISGFRVHPFDGVIIAPAFGFLLAAGFNVEIAGLLAVFQIVLGIFFHANVRVRWRWLDKLVCNPEFHHWHHANESDAIGHNYGAALPCWDLLFGTFFMPKGRRRPEHYGIDEYLPRHTIGMLVHPLRGARSKLRYVVRPIKGTQQLFGFVRALLRDVWAVSTRPTHSIRRETVSGCSSTNGSLFPPHQAPGRRPAGLPVQELMEPHEPVDAG